MKIAEIEDKSTKMKLKIKSLDKIILDKNNYIK